MKCRHVSDLVSYYLGGELAAGRAAEVEAHLAGCEGCRSEMRAMSKALRALEHPIRVLEPPDVREEAKRLAAASSRMPHFAYPRWAFAGAAAALAVCAVMAWHTLGPVRQPGVEMAEAPTPVSVPAHSKTPEAPVASAKTDTASGAITLAAVRDPIGTPHSVEVRKPAQMQGASVKHRRAQPVAPAVAKMSTAGSEGPVPGAEMAVVARPDAPSAAAPGTVGETPMVTDPKENGSEPETRVVMASASTNADTVGFGPEKGYLYEQVSLPGEDSTPKRVYLLRLPYLSQ